jgi:alpha-mannosidase
MQIYHDLARRKHTRPIALAMLSALLLVDVPYRGVWAQAPSSAAPAPIRSVAPVLSPLVLRTAQGERQILRLSVDSAGLSNATIRLTSKAWPEAQTKSLSTLAKGRRTVEIEVPPLAEPASVSIRFEAPGAGQDFGPFDLQPPRRWTVYLAQHTHTDIGYTRPQTEILPEHIRYIDYALDYCDLTDAYPEEARFRWTCETSWAVREYLKGRPAPQIERLKKRVSEGRIEICGLMLNMSELASESSLAALLRPLRLMKDEFGITVRTAMQNDVNGAGWCLPDYFSEIGIRYLTMGINQTRSILPFDKPTPFWWESPSGKRVLAYRADHYHLGNFWHIHEGKLDRFKPGLESYLLSLQQRGYALDRAGVQFSGYHTDNSPPSTAACDLVQEWNKKYAWPRLRLATAQEFLAWVEKEQADKLPVHRQAWPDWWTDGFGSAARETAAARETESAIQVSHGLMAISSMLGARIRPQAMQRAAAVQDNLLFYHEHTYGAAESISDPLAENTQVQWGEKASYVWSAVKDSNLLREEAFGLVQDFLPRAEVPTLAIFNTLNWPRSGLVRVFIDHEILPPDRQGRLLDGTEPVLMQPLERRAEGTYWALWVREVPPLGYKVLRLEPSDTPRAKATPGTNTLTLENAYYRLTLDDQRGAIASLVDKESGAELVDRQSSWGLGQLVYETMPPNRQMKPEVFKRTSLRAIKVKPGASGPIWRSLLLTAALDGCATNNGVQAELRLYETEKRAELHFALRKLPVPSPESVYVAFPFQSSNWQMLYEAQGGCVVPGREQIPGSASDWQTLQSFLSIRSDAGQIVVGCEQVPLVQLGDFNLGKWQRITQIEKPHFYSWVMNNYWFTNFRTEQEGEFKWHYYLTSMKDSSRSAATQFGWGSRIPLAARVLPPTKTNPAREPQRLSTITLNAPGILLVEARPMSDGEGIFLHYRETEGRTTTVRPEDVITWAPLQGADEVDALEQPVRQGLESLTFQPYEVRFVRARFR